jgi:protein tyrosine phosphatase (PTP) superfamily phosphohydrolase (DUF442 family)
MISGGLPEGDVAFKELADLGIKTIISVDGAKPDVATARRHGLRYVHLPHGYDGVPAERGKELAKAVRDLPGPIYIHCHHGKHRSPAAAAVSCVGSGLIEPKCALTILTTAGTSENYRGLYKSATDALPFGEKLLNDLKVEFPEIAEIPPLAHAMVEIERTHEHLKRIAKADWKTPADHPALDPAHEALLLREHFTELLRTEETAERPEEFQNRLRESEQSALLLETLLRQTGRDNTANERATKAFARITQNCQACHRQFRDVPLGEK